MTIIAVQGFCRTDMLVVGSNARGKSPRAAGGGRRAGAPLFVVGRPACLLRSIELFRSTAYLTTVLVLSSQSLSVRTLLRPPMLSQETLEDLRADAMADDVDITPECKTWSREQAIAYFESGGTVKPTPPPPADAEADITLRPAGRSRFADKPTVFKASDGCRIVYQFSPGPKTPIVFLGGGTSGRAEACRDYGAESPQLQEHAILILDRRGAGSGASDVKYEDGAATPEVKLQAQDVIELITHLGVPPVILYGWSSGARLFGIVALRQPSIVRALVLCILTGGADAANYLGDAYYLQYAKAAAKGGMARVLRTDGFAERVSVNGQVAPYLASLDPAAFAATMRASAQLFQGTANEPALGLAASDLATCRLPALVVYNRGEPDDGMHTEAVSRAVARALPEAELVVSTRMQEWYGAILRFFEKHSAVP